MKPFLLLFFLLFITACKHATETYEANTQKIFYFKLGDSGSMRPALSVGDAIYIDISFPYDKLKVGDIIAYYDPQWGISYGLLHRIHALSKNDPKEWIVKGDNNISVDPFNLTEHNYDGKVIRVDFE